MNVAVSGTLDKSDFSVAGYTIHDVAINNGKILISRKVSLSSQVFHEDFEDQTDVGNVTNATIVSGVTGSNYALQGDGTQANKVWWQSTSDSLPTDIKAIGFWHYAVEENGSIYLIYGLIGHNI